MLFCSKLESGNVREHARVFQQVKILQRKYLKNTTNCILGNTDRSPGIANWEFLETGS